MEAVLKLQPNLLQLKNSEDLGLCSPERLDLRITLPYRATRRVSFFLTFKPVRSSCRYRLKSPKVHLL